MRLRAIRTVEPERIPSKPQESQTNPLSDGKSFRVPDEPLARADPAFLEWRFDRFKAVQT